LSDYLVSGSSPSGVDWGYTLTSDAVRMCTRSHFATGIVEFVAAMLELDVQGDDPHSQSAAWKLRRQVSFAEWLKVDTPSSTEQQPRRRVSSGAVSLPIAGMRKDLIEVAELGGIGGNPLDTLWHSVTQHPVFKTKSDDVIAVTVADLLDEPGGGVIILVKPPPENMEIPPPRPGHDRSAGVDIALLVQPMSTGGLHCTTILEIQLGGFIRGVLQWIPGFMMQKVVGQLLEEDIVNKKLFFNSLVLLRTMQGEPRSGFYEKLRLHVQAFERRGTESRNQRTGNETTMDSGPVESAKSGRDQD